MYESQFPDGVEGEPIPHPAEADARAVAHPSWDRYMALAEEALNGARSSKHRPTSECLAKEAEGWVALANAVTSRDGLTVAREMAERQAQAWEG